MSALAFIRKRLVPGLALVTVSGLTFAQAATVDVSASVAEISAVKTAALTIGAAVFAVAVGIKLYKWLRSAL